MNQLKKKLKKLLKNQEIIDIIVFGSKAKNKISPRDLDLAILVEFKKTEIKKLVKKAVPEADIQLVSLQDIYSNIFLTLIKEGYSIKKDKYLHELYKVKPIKLYKYNLKQLTPSKKVMFERGIKNITGLNRLSNSVVLVPIENTGEFEDFLKSWDLDIESSEYELVPLMRKEEI